MRRSCDARHYAWPLFLRTYSALVEVLEHELQRDAGLPLAWFDVLVQLGDAPGGRMRMNDLADSVLLSKSGVTRLVDRMESSGLLTRGSCADDRRVVFATITSLGRAAFAKAAPVAARGVREHFAAHLTQSEEKALVKALCKVLSALGRDAQAAAVTASSRASSRT